MKMGEHSVGYLLVTQTHLPSRREVGILSQGLVAQLAFSSFLQTHNTDWLSGAV